MYAGIIIWSLCGGCRSTERLYFLKYCNPHLFCFSPETQLWGLCQTSMPWAGQWLSVCLVSDDLSTFCILQITFKMFAFTLTPHISYNLNQNTGTQPLDSSTFSMNPCSLSCPLSSAAVQEPKQVMFMVELGNRVSRIYSFNLAGDLHSSEKGSHSFSLEW